jgi:hypothetical protein
MAAFPNEIVLRPSAWRGPWAVRRRLAHHDNQRLSLANASDARASQTARLTGYRVFVPIGIGHAIECTQRSDAVAGGGHWRRKTGPSGQAGSARCSEMQIGSTHACVWSSSGRQERDRTLAADPLLVTHVPGVGPCR